MIVRSAGAISCSSGEEGVVEMISGAERKKKPWWAPLFDIISEPEPSIFFDYASSLSSMEAEAVAEIAYTLWCGSVNGILRGLYYTGSKYS